MVHRVFASSELDIERAWCSGSTVATGDLSEVQDSPRLRPELNPTSRLVSSPRVSGPLTRGRGGPATPRIDAPATAQQKAVLQRLAPEQVSATELAGEKIEAMLTKAPGNGSPIGGLKVETANGWFAARRSGTEEVYKLYAESFLGQTHLRRIQEEAQKIIARAFAADRE